MKIAIISPEFPPKTSWGGVATFNNNLAKLLVAQGNQVIIFTSLDVKNGEDVIVKDKDTTTICIRNNFGAKAINFLYYIFPFGPIRKILYRHFPKILTAFEWNFFSLLSFHSFTKTNDIDAIHTPVFGAPALFISLAYRNIPLIAHWQGSEEFKTALKIHWLDNAIIESVHNMYMRFCAIIIVACSAQIYKHLSQKLNIKKFKIWYIPNFINTNDFKNIKTRLNRLSLLFVGRLEYRKGTDLVAKAFVRLAKNINNLQLTFVGEDKQEWDVNGRTVSFQTWFSHIRMPRRVRKRVIFISRIDDPQKMISLLKQKRGIAVLPSRYEPFGFTYIETMMAGYIVLASSIGGGKEIIRDGRNGFLIKPSINEIVKTLRRAISLNAAGALSITQNARRTVKTFFSNEAVNNAYRGLYKSLGKNHEMH